MNSYVCLIVRCLQGVHNVLLHVWANVHNTSVHFVQHSLAQSLAGNAPFDFPASDVGVAKVMTRPSASYDFVSSVLLPSNNTAEIRHNNLTAFWMSALCFHSCAFHYFWLGLSLLRASGHFYTAFPPPNFDWHRWHLWNRFALMLTCFLIDTCLFENARKCRSDLHQFWWDKAAQTVRVYIFCAVCVLYDISPSQYAQQLTLRVLRRH